MDQQCTVCHTSFSYREEDKELLKKLAPTIGGVTYELPLSDKCPNCRKKQRLVWRNVRSLYKNTCNATGKSLLAIVPEDHPIPVYERDYWWSDQWNATDYGKDFDFSRSFFEQFKELLWSVPMLPLVNETSNVNSDYVNQTSLLKNCYLVFNADYNEDCYYSDSVTYDKNCMDTLRVQESELCYDDVDCKRCYNVHYSQDSDDCTDSYFLFNCRNCKHCFGCINLRNKEYCYFNKQLSKEEYEEAVAQHDLQTWTGREKSRAQAEAFFQGFPSKVNYQKNTENSVGNYLENTKNAYYCFDAQVVEDSAYVSDMFGGTKDCMDYDVWGAKSEKIYQCITVGQQAQGVLFSSSSWENITNLLYCVSCFMSTDCFGCVGLKRKKYHILNKEYTKEAYEALIPKIIEHMKKTGEWGEFFPPSLSPWCYNETHAHEMFPLTKDQAEKEGFRWKEMTTEIANNASATPPDNIADVNDTILKETFACSTCSKAYKIIPQELALYLRLGIPVAHKCYECRHKVRRAKRQPQLLFSRTCGKCNTPITTSMKEGVVYCELCFEKETY